MLKISEAAQHSLSSGLQDLGAGIDALRPMVDRHITRDRVERYLKAISDTPAPSTAASAMRAPVLRALLDEDGALGGRLDLDANYANTGGTVLLTGAAAKAMPLWYFAHLDTISYLVSRSGGGRHRLVPFCYHLTRDGRRDALCYRYDLHGGGYRAVAGGFLESDAGTPYFRPAEPSFVPERGDRIVPVAACTGTSDGHMTGHFDNAGGVAALAVAAPVLAEAGFDAMLVFPDEEEGPPGSGNQIMGRGGSRIINGLRAPDLAVIVDMQQSGEGSLSDDVQTNDVRLGHGAVLSEFSSLGRGAVTPPHLLGLSRLLVRLIGERGVKVQEPLSSYTSRSDDVSVMLKTPNILLLGFPGVDRHFDTGLPRANLDDIVNLSKAIVYTALLRPLVRSMSDRFGRSAP
ncbi:MAG: M20/M25/M40 family metallo-hydrolase [Rhizobiales bacterium]|nr:M20/M25/M40 family metallo-hydrolase [Hyphomicrobiales bacterium]